MKTENVIGTQSQQLNDLFAGLPTTKNPTFGYRIMDGDTIGIRGTVSISELKTAKNGNVFLNVTFGGEVGAYKKDEAGNKIDIKGVGSITAPFFLTYQDETGEVKWAYRGQAVLDSILINLNKGPLGGKCPITVQRKEEDNVKSSRYFFGTREIDYIDLIAGHDPDTSVNYLDFIKGALKGQTFTHVLKKDKGYFTVLRTHRWADGEDLSEIHANKQANIAVSGLPTL